MAAPGEGEIVDGDVVDIGVEAVQVVEVGEEEQVTGRCVPPSSGWKCN